MIAANGCIGKIVHSEPKFLGQVLIIASGNLSRLLITSADYYLVQESESRQTFTLFSNRDWFKRQNLSIFCVLNSLNLLPGLAGLALWESSSKHRIGQFM